MGKVGVLGERSGIVRDAFRARGHDAVSCDLYPSDVPGPHIQGDFFAQDWSGFGLLICHPDCTYLATCAAWAFKDGPYHQKVKSGTLVGAARRAARDEAVDMVRRLLSFPDIRIAVENPVGCLSSLVRKPDQIIQPWQFGDDASKATCLWLARLPILIPSRAEPSRAELGRLVEWPRESGKMVRRYANQTDSGQNKLTPGAGRAYERAKTYPGIAAAMAEQWGALL